MAVPNILNETLEAAGYSESGWSEGGWGTRTIDEDANVTDVSSPSGWDSRCLKITMADGDAGYTTQTGLGESSVAYIRVEFIITEENTANTNTFPLAVIEDDSSNNVAYFYIENSSGTLNLAVDCFHDGTDNWYTAFDAISLNTKYVIELKWDMGNNLWSWKVNGTVQPNDQDSSDPVTTEGVLSATHATIVDYLSIGNPWGANGVLTYYFDNIAMDNTGWIGEAEGFIPQIRII